MRSTQRFTSGESVSWNLMTRTNNNFQYFSLRLTILWGVGAVVRYCIILPLRLTLATIGLSWLVIGTTLGGFFPNCRSKGWLSDLVHFMYNRILARALSATIHYHNKHKPKSGGIFVANHTSPIDVVILANHGCYAMVGQVHGGLMGFVQRATVRSCPHIWFERAEMRDRYLVTQRRSKSNMVVCNSKLSMSVSRKTTMNTQYTTRPLQFYRLRDHANDKQSFQYSYSPKEHASTIPQ